MIQIQIVFCIYIQIILNEKYKNRCFGFVIYSKTQHCIYNHIPTNYNQLKKGKASCDIIFSQTKNINIVHND